MDIENLQIFVEVVRSGSFASVARTRDLDPSAVSRAIASLEQELGVRLFQRTTRRLTVTEAGSAYFERVAAAVDEVLLANEAAGEASSQVNGVLRMTTSVSLGQELVVPLLPKLTKLYPDLAIELLLTDTVLDLVAERIDLAVRVGTMQDSSLIAKRLIPLRYHVCASPAYLRRAGRVTKPSDIADHDCLLLLVPGFRTSWKFKQPGGKAVEVPIRGTITISAAVSMRECAVAGMGLALLPQWLIEKQLEDGSLVSVLPNFQVSATDFNSAVWLVHPSRSQVPLKVRLAMDFLQTHLGA